MEKEDRTEDDDDRMLHMAHASRHHWRSVGTPANLARREWLCSRVYAVLGRPEPCLPHAGESSTSARSTASPSGTSPSRTKRWRAPTRLQGTGRRRRRRSTAPEPWSSPTTMTAIS